MRVTRVATGDDGRSHFSDVYLPFGPPGRYSRSSAEISAGNITFRESPADGFLDLHNAPCRQFVVILDGRVEFACGDGSARQLGPGEILLAEDTLGEGHSSREIVGIRRSLFIPILGDMHWIEAE